MAKISALDKAIANIDQEIMVLALVLERLEVARGDHAKPKAKRGPRAVPGTDAKQAS